MTKILEHNGADQITVEYDDGTRLNISVSSAIVASDPRKQTPVPLPSAQTPAVHPDMPDIAMSTTYTFKAGQRLATHTHDDVSSNHDIRVVSGRVMVRKASGDVEAQAGDRILLALGEPHSVEGLADVSITVHTRQ